MRPISPARTSPFSDGRVARSLPLLTGMLLVACTVDGSMQRAKGRGGAVRGCRGARRKWGKERRMLAPFQAKYLFLYTYISPVQACLSRAPLSRSGFTSLTQRILSRQEWIASRPVVALRLSRACPFWSCFYKVCPARASLLSFAIYGAASAPFYDIRRSGLSCVFRLHSSAFSFTLCTLPSRPSACACLLLPARCLGFSRVFVLEQRYVSSFSIVSYWLLISDCLITFGSLNAPSSPACHSSNERGLASFDLALFAHSFPLLRSRFAPG